MSECIICGKSLRTGRKYCYLHRSLGRHGKSNRAGAEIVVYLIGICSLIWIGYYLLLYLSEHILTLILAIILTFVTVLVTNKEIKKLKGIKFFLANIATIIINMIMLFLDPISFISVWSIYLIYLGIRIKYFSYTLDSRCNNCNSVNKVRFWHKEKKYSKKIQCKYCKNIYYYQAHNRFEF